MNSDKDAEELIEEISIDDSDISDEIVFEFETIASDSDVEPDICAATPSFFADILSSVLQNIEENQEFEFPITIARTTPMVNPTDLETVRKEWGEDVKLEFQNYTVRFERDDRFTNGVKCIVGINS